MNTSMVPGSLSMMARQENKSLAETFMQAELIVIVDTSGSMSARDSRGGKSRYDVACEELANLQAAHPGRIAVIAFSNEVQFCPAGVPTCFNGGTNMAKALQFAKVADVSGMRFILISDGEPDDETETMRIAKEYRNPISTIYVGPEDRPTGRDFLTRLAKATGGQTVTVDRAQQLKDGIERLYLPG